MTAENSLLKTISNKIYEMGGNMVVAKMIIDEWTSTVFRHDYTDDDVRFIKSNTGNMSIKDMAKHICVSKRALEGKLFTMRKSGKLVYSENSIYYVKPK